MAFYRRLRAAFSLSMKKEIFVCDSCDYESEDESDFEERNDEHLCESCYDEKFPMCGQCSDRVPEDELVEVGGYTYCDNCKAEHVIECDDCGNYERLEYAYFTVNDEYVCGNCREQSYFFCDSCDRLLHNDSYGGNGECDNCYESYDEDEDDMLAGCVQNYSANVLHSLSPDRPKAGRFTWHPRLFGVELEVATESDLYNVAQHTYNLVSRDAILKQDGSIDVDCYRGFEIVTRPMTLDNHFTFWNMFLDKHDRSLRSYDVGTCGLHVHVTRASVSRLTIGKLTTFVNADANIRLIKRVAQRYSTGYSKKKDDACLTKLHSDDRYEFINLQNSNTIEFRMYKGTLNRTRLLACLEFTATLIEFCEQASIRELTTPKFLEYLKAQPKLKNLKTLLSRKPVVAEGVENQPASAANELSLSPHVNELVKLNPRTRYTPAGPVSPMRTSLDELAAELHGVIHEPAFQPF